MIYSQMLKSGEISADEVIKKVVKLSKIRSQVEVLQRVPTIEVLQDGSVALVILNEPNYKSNGETSSITKSIIKTIQIPESFGRRLKQRREELEMTQEVVADLIGVSRTTYAHYESNRRHPDISKISFLSDVFNCSLDYLMKGKWDISLIL